MCCWVHGLDFRGARNILDIGAGTGILSLMAAQRSGAQIVALEPDAGFIYAGRAEHLRQPVAWTG